MQNRHRIRAAQSSSSIPLLFLFFFLISVAATAAISESSDPEEQQQPRTTFRQVAALPNKEPLKSLKMLGPQKLTAAPGQRSLETEYFKPKEYSTRDFPRLVEGLGRQIRRDLDKAHSTMADYAEQVRRLEQRMHRLEAQLGVGGHEWAEAEETQPVNKFLISFCLFLLLALALLLCANFLLLKRVLTRNGPIKHVRLANSGDQEAI